MRFIKKLLIFVLFTLLLPCVAFAKVDFTFDIDMHGKSFLNVGTVDVTNFLIKEQSTPATPPSGYGRLYFGTDGRFFMLNDQNVNATIPRTATYVVAAYDAPEHVKAQADFVCDGVDDQVEIQAAIDSTTHELGGRIFLTEGTYNITSTIKVYRYIWLMGAGVEGTELKHLFNGDLISVEKRPGTTETIGFVRISGIYMSGYKDTYTGDGVVIADFSDCIIDHNFINGFAGAGIRLSAGYYHHIHDNWVEGNGYGLYIEDGVGNNFIRDNTFSYSAEDNIYDAGNHNKFIGNVIEKSDKNGYNSRGGSPWAIILGNIFNMNARTAGTYYDIDANGTGVIISENQFLDNDSVDYSIRLWVTDNAIVTENYFEKTPVSGYIFISPDTDNVIIKNNQGYITENSGTATITAGNTSVTVNHGLAETPNWINITPLGNLGHWYITARDDTSFTVEFSVSPDTDTDFLWRAGL